MSEQYNVSRVGDRVRQSLEAEERDGQRLAIMGRTIGLLAVAVLMLFIVHFPDALYHYTLLCVLIVLGLVDGWLLRQGLRRQWHAYLFAALDFGIVTFALLYPNPFATHDYTAQLGMRFISFAYFFMLLSALALTFRPGLVVFGGLAGACFWSLASLWIANLPDSITDISPDWPWDRILETLLAADYVDVSIQMQRVGVFLIVAALLAVIVARSRRLVLRQAHSERERGNLARYFPPSMVDRLARMDAPLSQVREQQVAVLFADVVGFSHWAEEHSPTELISRLRQVHRRLEEAVFRNNGTLDKFIGDGVMATFGTPETGPKDAANAVRALRAILDSFDDWNAERRSRGRDPVHVGVGVHYGPVIIGDIGSARRLEFAVLGDTVNVASRLERLTRDVGCRAIISEATVAQVRTSESSEDAELLLRGFSQGTAESVRGRTETVRIWTL
ncbi:MAG: adenylate/guanylate cyclase domain-containing protein [Pseudomonadota bacterium]